MGRLDPRPLGLRQRLAWGQGVFERTQHQGQGRSKLVGDVGEEGGLGPVDLRQGLGAGLGLLVGACGGHGRGHVARRQVEEGAVALVQTTARIDPRDEVGPRRGVAGQGDGQDDGLDHRFGPGSLGQDETFRWRGHHRRARGAQRPLALAVQRQHRRRPRGARLQSGGGGQPGDLPFAPIDQGEGRVHGAAGQGVGDPAAGRVDRQGRVGPLAHAAERAQAPFGQHALGGLDHGVEDARHPAVLALDRAEREIVVALFEVAMAMHGQELVLLPDALAARHHLRIERADGVPDLRPDLAAGAAEGPGVLFTKDRRPGVVIDQGKGVAPIDRDREARIEHDAHRRLQRLGPGLSQAKRRSGPVVSAHPRAHLPAAGQEARPCAIVVPRRVARSPIGHQPSPKSSRTKPPPDRARRLSVIRAPPPSPARNRGELFKRPSQKSVPHNAAAGPAARPGAGGPTRARSPGG